MPEVEAAVATLRRAGVAGARMVGGGFGGSVLALAARDLVLPDAVVAVEAGTAARLL